MTQRMTWPAERFFWAVLEAPGVKKAGELPPGLVTLLDEHVPVSVNDLHAVCVPLKQGRLAVCAAMTLELSDLPMDTLALTPDSLPYFFRDEGISAARFNMLVGVFEPSPFRKARLTNHAFAAGIALLCGTLLTIGLHRRASHWQENAIHARAAAKSLAASVIADGRPDDLASQAARLRGIDAALLSSSSSTDAAVSLAAFLSVWPANVPSRPQSISVRASGISVAVSLDGDPSAFLSSLTPPAGWALDEPRLNTSDTVTRLSLNFRPLVDQP